MITRWFCWRLRVESWVKDKSRVLSSKHAPSSAVVLPTKFYLHLPGKIAIVSSRFIFHHSMKSKSLFLLTGIFSLVCFLGTTQAAQTGSLPANVNFAKVEAARLDWQNQERAQLGLVAYTGNELLGNSAQIRAESLKERGGWEKS